MHVASELQGAGDVAPRGHDDLAAAIVMGGIDGRLDGLGVVRLGVADGAMVDDVVVHGVPGQGVANEAAKRCSS